MDEMRSSWKLSFFFQILFIFQLYIMNKYELVCVLDTSLSSAAATEKKQKIESIVTNHQGSVLETDDLWLMPLAYPLNGQMQAYIISYYIALDPKHFDEIKMQFSIEKWLAKYFFYSMKDGDTFLKFSDLQQRHEAMFAVDEEEEEVVSDDTEKVDQASEEWTTE